MDSFYTVIGSRNDDFIFTSAEIPKYENTCVIGRGGDDIIKDISSTGYIDFGSDVLIGNMGNDTITTHAGEDFLYGGKGDDRFLIDKKLDDENDVHIRGGAGIDTLEVITGHREPMKANTSNGVETCIDMGSYNMWVTGIENLVYTPVEDTPDKSHDFHF